MGSMRYPPQFARDMAMIGSTQPKAGRGLPFVALARQWFALVIVAGQARRARNGRPYWPKRFLYSVEVMKAFTISAAL
jgi:hypothetical protein